MAYDEYLAERINKILDRAKVPYTSKKMMGGLCYLLDGKMLCGINGEELMARINPEIYETSLELDGINEMNFTGRAMKGYIYASGVAIDMDEDLENWVNKCLEFNPLAKASKKKKKKA